MSDNRPVVSERLRWFTLWCQINQVQTLTNELLPAWRVSRSQVKRSPGKINWQYSTSPQEGAWRSKWIAALISTLLFTVNMNCLDTRRVDSIKCIALLCLCVRVRCVWCVSARFRTRSYSHLSLLLAVMPSKRTDPSAVYVKWTTPNLPTYDAFAQPFPTVCQRSVALQQ